ncbi:MAG: efflux RND transporter permease subunit [Planctomycetes bacterium]|nr:efflux RND transporter permease subunit [Planctomycetota bacterium]
MKSILAAALRQSIPLNVLFVGVVLYGVLVAVPQIPVDRYPNFSFAQAQVRTLYPGAAPRDVERRVTRLIEDSIRDMDDVEWVSSVSVHGQSEVLVKFVDDTDYEALFDELRFRVLGVQNRLPVVNGDPLQPICEEIDTDFWVPVVQISITSRPDAAPLDKRALTLLAKELRDRLELVDGVKRVGLMGEEAQQYVIALDPRLLSRHRLTPAEVVVALRATGRSLPGGTLALETGERTVRIDSRFRTRDDLLGVVVRREGDGGFVRVGDLVDPVSTAIGRVESSIISSINGRETVGCKVLKMDGASALDIRDGVLAVVDQFRREQEAAAVDVFLTHDSTVKINDSMAILYDSFMLAVALVIATLFFFLTRTRRLLQILVLLATCVASVTIAATDRTGLEALTLGVLALLVFVTCRSAVLTVSGIVFSFLGTLVVFYVSGQSLNEISLLGFVLTVGIIVDDAIIVLENIERHREQGTPIARAAIDGTAEVAGPVISATLTTCAAFLPMLLMTGSTGDFFALLPIAVSTALAISLVEALVILPVHAVDLERWLGPERMSAREADGIESLLARHGIVGWLARIYDRHLHWNLRHPVLTILIVFLLFGVAIGVVVQSAIAPGLGQRPILTLRFFPEDTSNLNLRIRLRSGSSLAETDRVVREISRILIDLGPGTVRNVSGFAGMTIDRTYRPSWNHQHGFLMVELPSRGERDFDDPSRLISTLRTELGRRFEPHGIHVEVTAQQDGPPTGAPVSVRALGTVDRSVERLSQDLYEWMIAESSPGGRLEGVIDLVHDRDRVDEVFVFEPDREALAKLGLTDLQVQEFVAGAFEGTYVGDYLRPDDEIPVRVRLSRSEIHDPVELLDVPIAHEPEGRVIRFADIGTLASAQETAALRRREFQRAISVTGNFSEDARLDSASVTRLVSDWYAERAGEYPGASLAFLGEAEHTAKSFRSLFTAFGLAVFLIYFVLSAQFRSLGQPLIILSNVVFSFTGVVLVMALLALGSRLLPGDWIRPERSMLTISSFIAIVGLTGIVVNDAIVLIDFINQRRREGAPLQEALRVAGLQRMRPILMTTISTIAGLLPMAIGIPYFSISWSPFATCFVAGLTVSTAMTLLVIPVLYQIFVGRGVDSAHGGAPVTEEAAAGS